MNPLYPCFNRLNSESHYREHPLHQNHHIHKHSPYYTAIVSYNALFLMCLISIMTISSTYSLAFDISHMHRFRQLGFISSHTSAHQSQNDDGGHRNDGSSPYHMLYDKNRIEPFFDNSALATNVTISEGSAATYLPCRVHQLGDRTVSWIRRKDLHVITGLNKSKLILSLFCKPYSSLYNVLYFLTAKPVGKFTYTSDQRFQAVHMDNSDDWTLQIRYPQRKDAGIYECQVSTLPKMSLFVYLNVIVAKAKIIGGPSLYINSGSTLNLSCVVNEAPGPPDYIFWYHNGEVINYDSPRGIKVQTEKSAQTTSKLIINKAMPNDSGNYSCSPSNAEPAHIAVHIHSNGNPAASIQHGKRSARDFIANNAHKPQHHIFSNLLITNTGLLMIYFAVNIHHKFILR